MNKNPDIHRTYGEYRDFRFKRHLLHYVTVKSSRTYPTSSVPLTI